MVLKTSRRRTMDSLQNLKSRVHGGSSAHALDENDIIVIHDLLMSEYGWIPLDEFKKIPSPTMWGLMNQIKLRHEAEQKSYENSKRRGRR